MYRCPKCHVELPADARFCKNCGFNQTNARIASMPPAVQGVQRQAPPQTPQGQGAQQPPTRTIQPQHKYVPQPPVTPRQGGPQQANTNRQAPQQNFSGGMSLTPQEASKRTSMPQNVQQPMLPTTPRPQQSEVRQRSNGSQQVMYVPTTPPLTTPQQGNVASKGSQQQMASSRPTGYSTPQGPSNWVQQAPVTPQGPSWGRSNSVMPEQVVRVSTPPTQQYIPSNRGFEPLQWGLSTLPETPVSAESLEATSKAAQHWRQSWVERQRAEAGPAVDVSRGQASVPEPLLAMQNSFARMRAIILPKNGDDGRNSRLRYWLPVMLLVCLIGGLSTYVLSTYSGGLLGTALVATSTNVEPTLSMKTTKVTTVAAGQTVHVRGEHFGPNDTILFFLGDTQLQGTNGKPVSVQSNDRGIFDTSLTIPSTKLAGEYAIQAQDNHTGQHAFLDIQTTASTTANVVKLSMPSLTFASIVGHNDPHGQNVDITNTSNTAIQWSAIAISDNQAGWLLLANGKTGGQLEAGGTDRIRVNVFTQGLTSNPAKPYTGEVVFTIAGQGQVTLPVQLTISEAGVELVVNPNPLIALESPTIPGACQDTTLTLINLSNATVSWNVQTDNFSQQYITLDGKPNEQGQLFPAGSLTDTYVIKVGCNGVQPNKQYAVIVYYNGSQQLVPISVFKG